MDYIVYQATFGKSLHLSGPQVSREWADTVVRRKA